MEELDISGAKRDKCTYFKNLLLTNYYYYNFYLLKSLYYYDSEKYFFERNDVYNAILVRLH